MDLPRDVRRKGGRFRAVIATGDGRRWYGPTRATAEAAAQDAAVHRSTRARSADSTTAPCTLLESWTLLQAELSRSQVRPGTLDWMQAKWRGLTGPKGFGVLLPLAVVTPAVVERFVAQRRAAGVSESTIWRCDVMLLRRLIRAAMRAGRLDVDPLVMVRAPRFRRGRFGVLSPQAIEQVAQHCAATSTKIALRNAAIVRFLAATGVRRAELARMQAADVDFDLGRVRVDGKTGHRWLPLVGAAADAARTLFASATTRPTGHAVRSVQTIETVLRDARRATGIPISAHVLRHSFATQAVRAGVAPFVLASLLGHSGIAQTWRYYHSEGPEQVEAMRRIGEAIHGHRNPSTTQDPDRTS